MHLPTHRRSSRDVVVFVADGVRIRHLCVVSVVQIVEVLVRLIGQTKTHIALDLE